MKTQQERASLLIHQGNELRSQKKYDQAIAAYRKAIELIPAYGTLNLAVGDMLFELQRYAEAAEAYRLTIAAAPEHDQAWGSLGQALLLLGEYSEAVLAFEKAVALHPRDALSHYYGAVASARIPDLLKAHRFLERALLLRPDWMPRAQADPALQPLFNGDRLSRRPGHLFAWLRSRFRRNPAPASPGDPDG